jgi:serine/threonine-protein kinase
MIGQQLGSFQIDEKIGAGAMGVVYRATHVKTGRAAAVKVVTAEQMTKGNAADRFEREAEILQQFRHPNIVRFFAVGRSKGIRYFAMEFIQGQTLEHILEDRGFLPWQDVVELGLQLCEALQYAHERGVVHRDLKPSNIMLTLDGRLKLTDFGIAKDLDATALTATGRTLGTAAYMAPEQIRGTPEVSHKTDLYALGCLLYQMLVGQPPFKGSQIAVLMNCHLNEPPPRPSSKNPEVPRALDDLILNLMSKSPSDRPWDAQVVVGLLSELRDKVARGETIKMVFGAAAIAPRAPTGATLDTAAAASPVPTSATKARKSSKGKKKRGKGWGWKAPSLTTLGLAGAFVALLGLVIYLLLPPTAEQLYAKARPLMESTSNEDWDAAERRYLSELDRRFPDHPHGAEVRKFRDKAALHRAERRAKILQSSMLATSDKEVESLYLRAATSSNEAVKIGDEQTAAGYWLNLAELLEKTSPEERGWILLAQKNAAELGKVVERRKQEVGDLLADAAAAEANGNAELARNIRLKVLDQYGRHPYLHNILGQATMRLPEGADTSRPPTVDETPPSDSPDGNPAATDSATPPTSKPADPKPPESPDEPGETPPGPECETPMNVGEMRGRGDSAN